MTKSDKLSLLIRCGTKGREDPVLEAQFRQKKEGKTNCSLLQFPFKFCSDLTLISIFHVAQVQLGQVNCQWLLIWEMDIKRTRT